MYNTGYSFDVITVVFLEDNNLMAWSAILAFFEIGDIERKKFFITKSCSMRVYSLLRALVVFNSREKRCTNETNRKKKKRNHCSRKTAAKPNRK